MVAKAGSLSLAGSSCTIEDLGVRLDMPADLKICMLSCSPNVVLAAKALHFAQGMMHAA